MAAKSTTAEKDTEEKKTSTSASQKSKTNSNTGTKQTNTSNSKSNASSSKQSTSKSSSENISRKSEEPKKSSESRVEKTASTDSNKSEKSERRTKTAKSSQDQSGHTESSSSSGKKQIRNFDKFVETEEIKGLLDRSQQYLEAGYPVHFTGPAGVGKTTMALQLAKRIEQPVVLLNGNRNLSNVDLIGAFAGYTSRKFVDNYVRKVYKREDKLNEHWAPGHLLEAAQKGYTVIYDEFTRSHPETNNILLPLLEEGILPLYGAKQKDSFVSVHPNFKMILTSNPEEYAGVYETQDALVDRIITISMGESDADTQTNVLMERTDISEENASLIVNFIEKIRHVCKEDKKNMPSFRTAVMIAEICKSSGITVDSKDSSFLKVCTDIVGMSVQACKEETDRTKVEEFIQQELKKS
ncbi:gas vesicle protein GvpN [Alteribacillus sp. HJP-4]|uniref:gas vesicle protein GvpN n=1 Tax=Alteribacillus sp. HJP-4 TaxID=2775394 RepID=UPI0035CD1FF7